MIKQTCHVKRGRSKRRDVRGARTSRLNPSPVRVRAGWWSQDIRGRTNITSIRTLVTKLLSNIACRARQHRTYGRRPAVRRNVGSEVIFNFSEASGPTEGGRPSGGRDYTPPHPQVPHLHYKQGCALYYCSRSSPPNAHVANCEQ